MNIDEAKVLDIIRALDVNKVYLVFDTLYNHFEDNCLFSSCQSGFRKGDSCISKLLSITHDIFKGFDANSSLDTRGVFLDISKAFDRVGHKGLILWCFWDLSLSYSWLSLWKATESCFEWQMFSVEAFWGRDSPRFYFRSTIVNFYQWPPRQPWVQS